MKLAGIFLERKVSPEEIEKRYEWIKAKQSKSHSTKDRNCVTRQVHYSDKLSGLYCVKFSPKGDVIATGYGSGCIQLRNGETGELRTTIRSALESSLPITCCRFHPINKQSLYASSVCGRIFICHIDKIEFWKFVEEFDNEIYAIDVNISGEYIVSGGKDTGLKVYDSETAKLIRNYKKNPHDFLAEYVIKYHSSRIYAAKCHKTNSNLIVTGGWDDTVKIWDTRVDNGCIKSINGPHICGDAIDIQDTKILTGSWVVRDSLQVWDMRSGALIETIRPGNREASLAGDYLYCAQFFDGDPYGEHALVGGSGAARLEILDLKEKSVAARFGARKPVTALDSYSSSIVYGGMDRTITFADYN